MIRVILVLSVLFFISSVGHTQEAVTLEELPTFIEWYSQNDYYQLRNPSDRYFTSGNTFTLQTRKLGNSKWALSNLFPFRHIGKEAQNIYQVQIHHQLYSPFDIKWADPKKMDRPYASLAFLTLGNLTYTQLGRSNWRFEKRLHLGWAGPALGGEALQNWYHKLTNNPEAKGWRYELLDQPIVQIDLASHKALGNQASTPNTKWHSQLVFYNQLQIGSLFGWLDVGLRYQLGNISDYFLPRTIQLKGWKGYAYFDIKGRGVFYNNLITGKISDEENETLFKNTETNTLVIEGEYGFVIRNGKWELRLSQYFLTPELRGGAAHYRGGIGGRKYF
ncbi:MAG: lipid A-modifier LpxR family protein [Bacteroidota bacterium]